MPIPSQAPEKFGEVCRDWTGST